MHSNLQNIIYTSLLAVFRQLAFFFKSLSKQDSMNTYSATPSGGLVSTSLTLYKSTDWLTHLPLGTMAAILADNFTKFVTSCPIDNNPALLQVMAWRQIGAKPLSEPMLTESLTNICGIRGRKLTHFDWLHCVIIFRKYHSLTMLYQFRNSHHRDKTVWR